MKLEKKVLHWLLNGHIGTSSRTMAAIAVGETSMKYGFDRPHDSGDFSRCYDLVREIPEIKDHFDKIKELCPRFGPIIDNWETLCSLYEEDQKRPGEPGKCHAMIYSLSDECYIAAGYTKVSWGWTKEK